MRSQGQVRFIKVSSRTQVFAAILTLALLGLLIAAVAAMSITQYIAGRERIALNDRASKVAAAEGQVNKYRENLDSVASDLVRRQEFIEQMVDAYIGDLPATLPASDPQAAANHADAPAAHKISASFPEASKLGDFERKQLAFVASLTQYAEIRAEEAAAAIRRLGLNPNAMVASANGKTGRGGPYFSLATSRDGSLDPQFQRLGVSLARMDALERSLAGIPQVRPASMDFISSGFGYRSDPFNGSAAFHAGLDFRGPIGAPIYAAANGRVSFAGRKPGYGNVIDIDHGNGLMTRYAHMSKLGANVGQTVKAGHKIGAIGNTGRSTGPHLHFEVRVHDRPVNPRPFLKVSRDVDEQKVSAGA